MRIEITPTDISLTEAMRDHMEKRMLKLKRYFSGVIDCRIFARCERFIYRFEIRLHGNGFDLFAEAHSNDMVAAFESAADKIERQVRKLKDRIVRKKGRRHSNRQFNISQGEVEEGVEEYAGDEQYET